MAEKLLVSPCSIAIAMLLYQLLYQISSGWPRRYLDACSKSILCRACSIPACLHLCLLFPPFFSSPLCRFTPWYLVPCRASSAALQLRIIISLRCALLQVTPCLHFCLSSLACMLRPASSCSTPFPSSSPVVASAALCNVSEASVGTWRGRQAPAV